MNIKKTLGFTLFILVLGAALLTLSCGKQEPEADQPEAAADFQWQVDQFADIRILRYRVPGFEELTPRQKALIYYLSEAAVCGRDIIFTQNYKHNLTIRRTLDAIVEGYEGERSGEMWDAFMVYVKRVWFSNGIHHHYSTDKLVPGFSPEYFAELVRNSGSAAFPVVDGGTRDDLIDFLTPILFDPEIAPKKVSQDASGDLVADSAVNFYEGVTQEEVEAYYRSISDPGDATPVSYGLNSRVVKRDGKIVEEVYKIDGLYGPAIEKIVDWLEKAAAVAETEAQKRSIDKLIEYYRTGDLETFDEYSILWLNDTESHIDFINGFIEVYNDPLGMKATYESVVNFKDLDATRRTEILSENAQWFEDNSPIDPRFKRDEVKGVTAKVITTAMLGGDTYPDSPVGINLPNATWIRREHGSKSVTMENISYAYDQAALTSGAGEEFAWDEAELERSRKYGSLAGNLHTDMHECLGHAAGKMLPGVGTDALKNYHSPVEESRADLFALYFLMDPKMVELGLLPDLDAARAAYASQIKNGLMTQLKRIEPGKTIEQAHMRGRALIAHWVYEKGRADNVIERKTRDGKTFFVINDYDKLRALFGELLAEVQRITSEGDYEAAKALVEDYGVQVDTALHKEVLARYEKLDLAPYGGFMNPLYTPVMEGDRIVDVQVEYPADYARQMLRYGRDYSYLK